MSSPRPPPPPSTRIPPLALPHISPQAKETLDRVARFVEEDCLPADTLFHTQIHGCSGSTRARFAAHPPILEELKRTAKKLDLWNLFLPKNHFPPPLGKGFSNLEYGLMAEQLGKSVLASEACNCNAPDTGNMELLAKYGNEEQKRRWLRPLLEGEIRSAFLMTEPEVSSSDATNMQFEIRREGGEYVLNGQKWWSTGAGDLRCKIYLVMGLTSPTHEQVHKRQSVVLVPADTKGITVKRMLSVFGYDDAPHGHGQIVFENVRVPASNMVLGEGRGFEIVQGRLGPGRIHHAMRTIGAAEKALEYFIARTNNPLRQPFGNLLSAQSATLERLAHSRVEIDAARLIVLNAAAKIDEHDARHALVEIAEAKILVPTMALAVIDRAIQVHGGAGVSQDSPLAAMYASGRTMRLVDGPDEVHLMQLGKMENRRAQSVLEVAEARVSRVRELFERYDEQMVDPLELGRVNSEVMSPKVKL